MEKRFKVGYYNADFNAVLGIDIKAGAIFQSKGLKAHMLKRKHFKAAKYIDKIPEILSDPDYIGKTGTDDDISVEYVKCFEDNMLLVIKVDNKDNSLYVATMFELPQKKLNRFIHSGRLKACVDFQK